VAASPASQSVVQAPAPANTVTVTPSGGFTGTVSFSVSGLPAGAAATFNPTSVLVWYEHHERDYQFHYANRQLSSDHYGHQAEPRPTPPR